MALDEALAAAEERRTFCQTVPSMNAYQPLATSALEVCVSAAQVCLLYFSRATIATDQR
jgi:hypothetical protein